MTILFDSKRTEKPETFGLRLFAYTQRDRVDYSSADAEWYALDLQRRERAREACDTAYDAHIAEQARDAAESDAYMALCGY